MAYNNNYQQNPYQHNQYMSEYYNNQGDPSASTSNYPTTRVQDLNQRYLTKLDTGNNSTKSLGEATAVGTPRVNPTENVEEVDPINSSSLYQGAYNQQGGYNRQDQGGDAMVYQHQQYGQPRYSNDGREQSQPSSHPGSILTTKDQPLIGQSTYDLGQQNYSDYNQSSGYLPQYNKYHRQEDPYYDEEATRHNTLTSQDPNSYGFENDYTDRDFPGGGKGARQSMTGEHLFTPEKKKKRCCGCCSWPICLLITLVIFIALGVTGFFVLPRVPTVSIKDAIPASQPNISANPPFINMDFKMVVEINNLKNYVPYKFNKIDVTVFDRAANNGRSIATGAKLDYTLQPKRIDTIDFPLTVNYTGQGQDDPVIQDFINACSPRVKQRTPLKLRVDVELFVWGVDWIYKPKVSVPIPDMKCPDVI